jgi:hypothetical protein
MADMTQRRELMTPPKETVQWCSGEGSTANWCFAPQICGYGGLSRNRWPITVGHSSGRRGRRGAVAPSARSEWSGNSMLASWLVRNVLTTALPCSPITLPTCGLFRKAS